MKKIWRHVLMEETVGPINFSKMAMHDKFYFLQNNRLCLFSCFLYARNILMPRNAHGKILKTFENQKLAFLKTNFSN
jgi:hypothetical protein